jgi:hypothetical protein
MMRGAQLAWQLPKEPVMGPGAFGLSDVLARSFRTAYLLTGSTEEAESAVLTGIESWSPAEESDEALFHKVVGAALRTPREPSVRTKSRMWLPEELKAVLTLAPPIRTCFVLRTLAGMSAQACAGLLDLLPYQVDEYAGAAHQRLAESVLSN